MFLTGVINTLTSTGSPDYTICSQAVSPFSSLLNVNFKLSIGKTGGSTINLVNSTDMSAINITSNTTYNFGAYDILFETLKVDSAYGNFQLKVQIYVAGTTDIVTWERFYVMIETSKTGYQPFSNTFEFYNYDIGNLPSGSSLTAASGNEDFNIILVNNTNNVDGYGIQQKAASAFIALRRPFSNNIYFYNMIGTQGTISYSTTNGVVGSGNGGFILDQEEDIYIEQTVELTNDSCTSGTMVAKKVWWPVLYTSYTTNEDNCSDDCVNNILETIATHYLDASITSIFKINNTSYFLSEFMSQSITTDVLNYKSEVIFTNERTPELTYANWIAAPTDFTTPFEVTFTPDEVGKNIISITNKYFYDATVDIELYVCITNYAIDTCNWWTIESQETCGSYILKNCSNNFITVMIQLMDDDKVFNDTTEEPTSVVGFEDLDLEFSSDGIYLIKVGTTDDDPEDPDAVWTYQYYSLPIYCALQTCILTYLKKTICNKVTKDNCSVDDHYNFNALLINAHTYFLLLNTELNYNYIYSTITTDKINELYTLKTFIDRFAEYCDEAEDACEDCGN